MLIKCLFDGHLWVAHRFNEALEYSILLSLKTTGNIG